MDDEKNVVSITLTYEDGTEHTVKRGFIASYTEVNDEGRVSFDLVGMKGEDLHRIVESVILLGDKLGFFNRKDDNNV